MQKQFTQKWIFLGTVFLIIASALTYLPYLHRVGYLYDDWYLMYAAKAKGPAVFWEVFAIDRPMRALVMIPAYILFKENPLYYNLNAYLMHVLSAISFWWGLRMLWPRAPKFTFIAALLFLLYPGFLAQLNGIDYQSQMVSLAAAMTSIALSFWGAKSRNPIIQLFALFLAAILGWFYMGLVEYEIGLEALRFLGLYILSLHEVWEPRKALSKSWKRILLNLPIPSAFLIWRVFFFHSERGATDIGKQLSVLIDAPLLTSIRWFFRLLTDLWDVVFLAWGTQISQINRDLRIRELFLMTGIAALLILLLYVLMRVSYPNEEKEISEYPWAERVFFGLLAVIAAQIPVIMVGREVNFSDFSRYALAGSAGATLLISAILYTIPLERLRFSLIATFLTIAVLTHQTNTLRYAQATENLRDFWWQVSWRAPQIAEKTTLVVRYAIAPAPEDYLIWGPANMIYYPPTEPEDIIPKLSALIPNQENFLVLSASHGKRLFRDRRSIPVYTDLSHILVLSQPSLTSCVHVFDGKHLAISPFERESTILFAQYSDMSRILPWGESRIPHLTVFGPEPPHNWCYYYQKASLARQQQNWDEILHLADEVEQHGFKPRDPIEWLPFLEAYAHQNKAQEIDRILKKMSDKREYFALSQICRFFEDQPQLGQETTEVITRYCAGFKTTSP